MQTIGTNSPLQHLEVEHKFVVGSDFDLQQFSAKIAEIKPHHQTQITVRDTYYVPAHAPGCIIRHRYDAELQHLTLKSVGSKNTEVRTEVNIDLGQHRGDQTAAVEAFLRPLGMLWSGELTKEVYAWHFPQCEIVYYRAWAGGKAGKSADAVNCVEFEAVNCGTTDEAIAVLLRYEALTGFDHLSRTNISLFEMLLAESMPANLKKL